MSENETLSVQTSVSTTSARLGDLIGLQITVQHPAYVQVDPPAVANGLGTFEVFASTLMPPVRSGDQSVTRFQAQLQNFTTGPQLIPVMALSYRDLMEKSHKIQSSSITITIQPMPPDPKANGDIFGIRGVMGPVGWSPWWWIGGLFLLTALGAWAWFKRKRMIEGPPPPPPEAPDERAWRLLKELQSAGWTQTGKLKEFYSALSDIVRGYLEGAFHVQALERTTSELMRDLRRKSQLSSEQQGFLKDLLENCDLVKFAKFRPDAAEADAEIPKALNFIETTWKAIHKVEAKP